MAVWYTYVLTFICYRLVLVLLLMMKWTQCWGKCRWTTSTSMSSCALLMILPGLLLTRKQTKVSITELIKVIKCMWLSGELYEYYIWNTILSTFVLYRHKNLYRWMSPCVNYFYNECGSQPKTPSVVKMKSYLFYAVSIVSSWKFVLLCSCNIRWVCSWPAGSRAKGWVPICHLWLCLQDEKWSKQGQTCIRCMVSYLY